MCLWVDIKDCKPPSSPSPHVRAGGMNGFVYGTLIVALLPASDACMGGVTCQEQEEQGCWLPACNMCVRVDGIGSATCSGEKPTGQALELHLRTAFQRNISLR